MMCLANLGDDDHHIALVHVSLSQIEHCDGNNGPGSDWHWKSGNPIQGPEAEYLTDLERAHWIEIVPSARRCDPNPVAVTGEGRKHLPGGLTAAA